MLVISAVLARNVYQRWSKTAVNDSLMLLLSRVLAIPTAAAGALRGTASLGRILAQGDPIGSQGVDTGRYHRAFDMPSLHAAFVGGAEYAFAPGGQLGDDDRGKRYDPNGDRAEV